MRLVPASLIACAACLGLTACGGSTKGGGPVTLNWWAYNEPSGSFTKAAQQCTKDSGGRYEIAFNALGNDPDSQRQSLVRRLAAKDSSIDMMSMDVIWTAEFAEAGWIRQWPQDVAAKVEQGTLKGPLATATYKGKLYAAPANSNTQLLWYRKDLVQSPPRTWDSLIDSASKMPKDGRVEIQGAQYEGTTVWFNALVASAGGKILDAPDKVGSNRQALQKAADIIHGAAHAGDLVDRFSRATASARSPSTPVSRLPASRTSSASRFALLPERRLSTPRDRVAPDVRQSAATPGGTPRHEA